MSDECFVNELFNGCNPCSVRVVDKANPKYNPEFKKIQGEDGKAIDLDSFDKGDLIWSSYPEIRRFAWPNVTGDYRGIYCVEPEVLTSLRGGKPEVIGIGFYFGKDG